MNKKSFLAAVLAVCMMLTLAACGGSDPAPEAPAAEADVSSSTTASTTTTTAAPTNAIPTPQDGEVLYTIKVVDTDGNPKAGVYVQLCLDTCVFAATDATGAAYFSKPEAEYKVAFTEQPEVYYYFEDGSREMTLVYDLAAPNAGEEAATDPSTNDAELSW